jgi:uncharacterized membrane protein
MDTKKLLWIVIILALLGVVDAAYLTLLHVTGTTSSFCETSETFDCSTVASSKYAELHGVPLAMFGLLGYGGIAVLAFHLLQGVRGKIASANNLFMLSFLALLFQGYFTFVEFFVIEALCLYCLISQAIVLGIAGVSFAVMQKEERINKVG